MALSVRHRTRGAPVARLKSPSRAPALKVSEEGEQAWSDRLCGGAHSCGKALRGLSHRRVRSADVEANGVEHATTPERVVALDPHVIYSKDTS